MEAQVTEVQVFQWGAVEFSLSGRYGTAMCPCDGDIHRHRQGGCTRRGPRVRTRCTNKTYDAMLRFARRPRRDRSARGWDIAR